VRSFTHHCFASSQTRRENQFFAPSLKGEIDFLALSRGGVNEKISHTKIYGGFFFIFKSSNSQILKLDPAWFGGILHSSFLRKLRNGSFRMTVILGTEWGNETAHFEKNQIKTENLQNAPFHSQHTTKRHRHHERSE
jgi:hypothetical protein